MKYFDGKQCSQCGHSINVCEECGLCPDCQHSDHPGRATANYVKFLAITKKVSVNGGALHVEN